MGGEGESSPRFYLKKVLFYLNGHPVHAWGPDPKFGDLATDVAFVLAKTMGGKAIDWAKKLKESIDQASS